MKEKIQYSQSGLTIESAENIQGAFVCPEKIIHIQDFAFSECEELTQLILSSNLSGIGQFAIANCKQTS